MAIVPGDEDNEGGGSSVAVTQGVKIEIKSQYNAAYSNPDQEEYFWSYDVKITNLGETTMRLFTRHWIITDANMQVEEVKGPGVVGHTPILETNQSFSYTSGCPLTTSHGNMRGSFQFRPLIEGEYGEMFDAEVAEFELVEPDLIL